MGMVRPCKEGALLGVTAFEYGLSYSKDSLVAFGIGVWKHPTPQTKTCV